MKAESLVKQYTLVVAIFAILLSTVIIVGVLSGRLVNYSGKEVVATPVVQANLGASNTQLQQVVQIPPVTKQIVEVE